MFIWMRVLGIELDPTSNPYRQIIFIYGLVMLLLCQWASLSFTANYFKLFTSIPNMQPKNSNILKSSTLVWNVTIDVINNFSLMSIVCPAFFLHRPQPTMASSTGRHEEISFRLLPTQSWQNWTLLRIHRIRSHSVGNEMAFEFFANT
jgi:hypothetical protein